MLWSERDMWTLVLREIFVNGWSSTSTLGFTFARGFGLGIEQMEEIVLVTGLHLTRSWANIVFLEGHANGHASLGNSSLGAFEEGCGAGVLNGWYVSLRGLLG
jgi:hypothetical protein